MQGPDLVAQLHDKKVFTLEGGTKIVSFTRKVAVLRERD
jgi:hypothetical protein